jgi:hypothetical protein
MSFHNALVGLAKQRKLAFNSGKLYTYHGMSQHFRNLPDGAQQQMGELDMWNLPLVSPSAGEVAVAGSKQWVKAIGGLDAGDKVIDWSDVWNDYKEEFDKTLSPIWVSRPVGELVQRAITGIDSNYILKPHIMPSRRGFIWLEEPWLVDASHPTVIDEHGNIHDYYLVNEENCDDPVLSCDEHNHLDFEKAKSFANAVTNPAPLMNKDYPHKEYLRAILFSHHDDTKFVDIEEKGYERDKGDMVPAINMYWLTECPIEQREHDEMDKSAGHQMSLEYSAGIKEHVRFVNSLPYDVPIGVVAKSLHDGDRMAKNSEEIIKTTVALFEFMTQKILEVQTQPMPKKWKNQKRGAKLERDFDGDVPAIQVVRLRRKEVVRQKAINDAIESGKISVRFVVREHFRNQCYCSIHGTTEYIHHPIRIEQHIKGPDDGEFKNPEKVFIVDR